MSFPEALELLLLLLLAALYFSHSGAQRTGQPSLRDAPHPIPTQTYGRAQHIPKDINSENELLSLVGSNGIIVLWTLNIFTEMENGQSIKGGMRIL